MSAMNETKVCDRCQKVPGSMECRQCAAADDENPYTLCDECNTIMHVGRSATHKVVTFVLKERGEMTKQKLQDYLRLTAAIEHKINDVRKASDSVKEMSRLYERNLRKAVTSLQQQLKDRAKMLSQQFAEHCKKKKQELVHCSEALVSQRDNIKQVVDSVSKALDDKEVPLSETLLDDLETQLSGSTLESHLVDFPDLDLCDRFNVDFSAVTTAIAGLTLTPTESPDAAVELEIQAPSISEGCEMNVTVSCPMSKQGTFWVLPEVSHSTALTLDSMSNVIRRRYIESTYWMTFRELGREPELGAKVYARFTADQKWYRAEVEEVGTMRHACHVRFIDYGNTEMVPYTDLIPMVDDLFSKCQPQAVECSLFTSLQTQLHQEPRWTFNGIVREINIQCTFKNKVEGVDRPIWYVDMSALNNEGAMESINKLVMEKVEQNEQPRSAIMCRDIRLTENENIEHVTFTENKSQSNESKDVATDTKVQDTQEISTKPSGTGASEPVVMATPGGGSVSKELPIPPLQGNNYKPMEELVEELFVKATDDGNAVEQFTSSLKEGSKSKLEVMQVGCHGNQSLEPIHGNASASDAQHTLSKPISDSQTCADKGAESTPLENGSCSVSNVTMATDLRTSEGEDAVATQSSWTTDMALTGAAVSQTKESSENDEVRVAGVENAGLRDSVIPGGDKTSKRNQTNVIHERSPDTYKLNVKAADVASEPRGRNFEHYRDERSSAVLESKVSNSLETVPTPGTDTHAEAGYRDLHLTSGVSHYAQPVKFQALPPSFSDERSSIAMETGVQRRALPTGEDPSVISCSPNLTSQVETHCPPLQAALPGGYPSRHVLLPTPACKPVHQVPPVKSCQNYFSGNIQRPHNNCPPGTEQYAMNVGPLPQRPLPQRPRPEGHMSGSLFQDASHSLSPLEEGCYPTDMPLMPENYQTAISDAGVRAFASQGVSGGQVWSNPDGSLVRTDGPSVPITLLTRGSHPGIVRPRLPQSVACVHPLVAQPLRVVANQPNLDPTGTIVLPDTSRPPPNLSQRLQGHGGATPHADASLSSPEDPRMQVGPHVFIQTGPPPTCRPIVKTTQQEVTHLHYNKHSLLPAEETVPSAANTKIDNLETVAPMQVEIDIEETDAPMQVDIDIQETDAPMQGENDENVLHTLSNKDGQIDEVVVIEPKHDSSVKKRASPARSEKNTIRGDNSGKEKKDRGKKLPKQTTEKGPQLLVYEGAENPVRVVRDIDEDGEFWVELYRTKEEENLFLEFLARFREMAKLLTEIWTNPSSIGQYAVFKDDRGIFHRTQVKEVTDKKVVVQLLDKGGEATTTKLYEMPSNFASRFPFQAVHCCLKTRKYVSFSEKARQLFSRLTKGKKLNMHVVDVGCRVTQVSLCESLESGNGRNILDLISDKVPYVGPPRTPTPEMGQFPEHGPVYLGELGLGDGVNFPVIPVMYSTPGSSYQPHELDSGKVVTTSYAAGSIPSPGFCVPKTIPQAQEHSRPRQKPHSQDPIPPVQSPQNNYLPPPPSEYLPPPPNETDLTGKGTQPVSHDLPQNMGNQGNVNWAATDQGIEEDWGMTAMKPASSSDGDWSSSTSASVGSKNKYKPRSGSEGDRSRPMAGRQHGHDQCYSCHEFGRHRAKCPKAKRDQDKMQCYICKEPGHVKVDCPRKAERRQGKPSKGSGGFGRPQRTSSDPGGAACITPSEEDWA